MVKEIISYHHGYNSDTVSVSFFSGNFWDYIGRKSKRDLSSVILPEQIKNTIIKDMKRFISSKEWYIKHGIPYRRGYLFYGPPGCGKTSLVFALASYFLKRIYVLNIGSIKNDDALIEATSTVPEDAILLIEDIDAAQKDRNINISETSKDKNEKAITMSGLLNAIDGILSAEGRILIMTTNHENQIDAALLKAGRADMKVPILELEYKDAMKMCHKFGKDTLPSTINVNDLPLPASQIQEALVKDTY